MPDPRTHMRCRRCARPLEWWEPVDGSPGSWHHPLLAFDASQRDDDHAPDPMPAAEFDPDVVGACDFCSMPGPVWAYPCADFQLPIEPVGRIKGGTSVGGWAACQACHDAIERHDWERVERNLKRSWVVRRHVRITSPQLDSTRQTWRLFRLNRTGPGWPT